jgi:uncharacterized membrane protein
MFSGVPLFIAFVAVGIPLAYFAGARDPEPALATLALYMFVSLAAITTTAAFRVPHALQRRPQALWALFVGVASCGLFFCCLELVHLHIHVLLAFVIGLAVSGIFSRFAPTLLLSWTPNNRWRGP